MTRAARLALWAAVGVAAIGGVALLGATPLPQGPESTFCVYRRATGMPCPGCGLTRAADHLASGRFAEAFIAHPMGPLLAAEAAIAWGFFGLVAAGAVQWTPKRALVEGLVVAHVVALIALWLGRTATGSLPW